MAPIIFFNSYECEVNNCGEELTIDSNINPEEHSFETTLKYSVKKLLLNLFRLNQSEDISNLKSYLFANLTRSLVGLVNKKNLVISDKNSYPCLANAMRIYYEFDDFFNLK